MKTKVFSVFPACGKTWLYEHQKDFNLKILDSDSSNFSWKTEKVALPDFGDGCQWEDKKVRDPEFPKNYIAYIKEQLEKDEYNAIFVSSHEEVRKALEEAEIDYTIIYPDQSNLESWIGRCYLRELKGTNGFPIKVLIDNWNRWINDAIIDSINHDSIILKHNEYLSGVVDKMFMEVTKNE